MAGAVRGAALDAVLPALHRAVHDRRRLAVVDRERRPLRGDHLLEVAAVRHLDHVPVVQVEQLHRVPLHVVARVALVAAHVVRVDRGLVPVDVDDHVVERGGGSRGERLGDPAGGEPALALDDVHAGRGLPVDVARGEGEADRGRDADPGGARREPDEGCRRRRVAVEGLRAVRAEERRRRLRVAPEAEEILETQPLPDVGRQQPRVGGAGELVAQRPHRVEAHRLVAGGVGHDVGVAAPGARELVLGRVEQEARHEAARGDRPARVARHRHVVVEERAEGPIEEVDRLEGRELARAEGGCRARLADLHPLSAPRAEAHHGDLHLFGHS